MVQYEWAQRGHLRVKAAGGQLRRGPLNMTGGSSETSAGDKKVESKSERKGKAGEMILATLFHLCPAVLKTRKRSSSGKLLYSVTLCSKRPLG